MYMYGHMFRRPPWKAGRQSRDWRAIALDLPKLLRPSGYFSLAMVFDVILECRLPTLEVGKIQSLFVDLIFELGEAGASLS